MLCDYVPLPGMRTETRWTWSSWVVAFSFHVASNDDLSGLTSFDAQDSSKRRRVRFFSFCFFCLFGGFFSLLTQLNLKKMDDSDKLYPKLFEIHLGGYTIMMMEVVPMGVELFEPEKQKKRGRYFNSRKEKKGSNEKKSRKKWCFTQILAPQISSVELLGCQMRDVTLTYRCHN